MKYQKSLDVFGYTEYLDKRGLSPKATRAKEMHKKLSQIEKKIRRHLDTIDVRLLRNSTTIITNSYFMKLPQILENTFKMWEEVNYPFREELLVRTATFKKVFEFSLPNIQVEITSDAETSNRIIKALPELNDPDQIILHPRLTMETLKEIMIVGRFHVAPGSLIAELGLGGIEHISDLDEAETVVQANLGKEINIDYVKGKEISSEQIRRLTLAAKIFTEYAEIEFVPKEKIHKPVVYEFQIIPVDEKLYMLFNDVEVL